MLYSLLFPPSPHSTNVLLVLTTNLPKISNIPGNTNKITNILIIAPLAIRVHNELIISISDTIPTPAVAAKNVNALVTIDLDELLSAVNLISSTGKTTQSRPTVCFTGKMPEKRSFYEKMAQSAGYQPVGDVSKELSLLVAADPSASGGKLDKAAKYGIKTISLDDFINMLENAENSATPETPAVQTNDADELVQGELF